MEWDWLHQSVAWLHQVLHYNDYLLALTTNMYDILILLFQATPTENSKAILTKYTIKKL